MNHDYAEAASKLKQLAKTYQWKQDMYRALKEVAVSKLEFTNDDVFDHYEKFTNPVSDVKSIDKRAYGPVVQKAKRDGLIEETGHFKVTRRKNCNQMLIRVWKSKIYGGYPYKVRDVLGEVNSNPLPTWYWKASWWQRFKKKYFDEVW